MKVFHGSTAIVRDPVVSAGRDHLDFGKGFYLTDLEEQAISWATRPLNASKRKFINVYDFDIDSALESGCRCIEFGEYNEGWLQFVVSNRKGGDDWKAYDIIKGGIANDRVFNTIELYSAGLISTAEALQRLAYEKPNNQICILNQEVVDKYLRFVTANEIVK